MPNTDSYVSPWAGHQCDLTFQLEGGSLNGTEIFFSWFQGIMSASFSSDDQDFLSHNITDLLTDSPVDFPSDLQLEYACAGAMTSCCERVCPSMQNDPFTRICMPGDDRSVMASPLAFMLADGLSTFLLSLMCTMLSSVAYRMPALPGELSDVAILGFPKNHIRTVMSFLLADSAYWPSAPAYSFHNPIARSLMFFNTDAPLTTCNRTVVLQDQSHDAFDEFCEWLEPCINIAFYLGFFVWMISSCIQWWENMPPDNHFSQSTRDVPMVVK